MDFTLLVVLSSLLILGSCCREHYEEVGSRCLLFEPTLTLDYKTSEQFCEYLHGKLVKNDQPQQLWDIVQHINNNLTLYTSYWVDGEESDEQWFYTDGSAIPLGTPFWATFINNNQEFDQEPINLEGETCLAIKKEFSYFFSSNACSDLNSPLCEEITGSSNNMSASSCGGELTTFSGDITSPNYPGAYPTGIDCIWTITRPEGSVIRLTLEDFDVWDSGSSYLEIRDGPYADSPVLGYYYGHKVQTPITFVTSSRHAWVRFKAVDNSQYRGFRLSWTTDRWNGDCHIDYNLSSGVIYSPWYYLNTYPPYLDCAWTITVDEGSFISLTVVSFQTEKDKDIVQIRDGADSNATLLIEMSDYVEQGYEVTSSNNHLFLSFTSDDENSGKGFAFMWTAKEICPSPYHNVGTMCLHFIFNDLTYGQSSISCEEMSGQLVAISNPQDLRDLYVYLQNKGIDDTSFWLGGTDATDEGLWKWKDDSLVPRGTPFWGTTGKNSEIQEPDGGETENCLLLEAEGFHYFRDARCDTKAPAICMYLIQ